MAVWAGVLGIVLLAVVNFDITFTVLSSGQPSFFSGLYLGAARRLLLVIAHYSKRRRRRVLTNGMWPLVVVILIASWNILLWASYSLIFFLTPDSVARTATGMPGNILDTIYVAGYGLFSLGVGDIAPTPGAYQLLLVCSCLNGVIVASMSVNYSLTMVSTFRTTAAVSFRIAALGDTPDQFIDTFWDGHVWDHVAFQTALAFLLHQLGPLLPSARTNPLILNFFVVKRQASIMVMIAVLCESLLLLQHGVRGPPLVPRAQYIMLRRSISHFFDYLARHGMFHYYSDDALDKQTVPAPLPLSLLERVGMPVTSMEAYEEAICATDIRQMRRSLLTLVDAAGWAWEDAVPLPEGVERRVQVHGPSLPVPPIPYPFSSSMGLQSR